MVKSQIRILGIDDGHFRRGVSEEVIVVGVVFRGADYLDVVLSTRIEVDGTDATIKLIKLINESRTKEQLRFVMLDGIALGGFNVVNIKTIYEQTKIPVIVFMRELPDMTAIKSALLHFEDGELRFGVIEKAGKIYGCEISNKAVGRRGKVFFQIAGTDEKTAREVLKLTCKNSLVPEPLRVAHLIAQGVVFGESKGRA
jgi:uncharacterized protein